MMATRKARSRVRRSPESKGAKALTSGTATPAGPGAMPAAGTGGPTLTSFDIFGFCIERAQNLIKIHKAAHGRQERPERFLADAHRAAIVLAISALDAYVGTNALSGAGG